MSDENLFAAISSLNSDAPSPTGGEPDMFEAILKSISDVTQAQNSQKDNYQVFTDYINNCKTKLEEILNFYYPDKWDIIETEFPDSHQTKLKHVINSLKACNQQELLDGIQNSSIHEELHHKARFKYVIYFPNIEITNGRDHHQIKDLWIYLKFSYLFKLKKMSGNRSSKTFAEYTIGYNHSHMETTSENTARTNLICCLGYTSYSTLSNSLFEEFDEDNAALFIQQLTDYLSWESLEGGPYCCISQIGLRDYTTDSGRRMSQMDRERIYQEFLKKYPSGYNVNLRELGPIYRFEIIKDEAFKQKVTDICPESYKMLFDSVLKKHYVEKAHSPTKEELERMNNNFKSACGKILTFKGTDIYFSLYDPEKESEKNTVKTAPESLANYIATRLENTINKFYQQEIEMEYDNATI